MELTLENTAKDLLDRLHKKQVDVQQSLSNASWKYQPEEKQFKVDCLNDFNRSKQSSIHSNVHSDSSTNTRLQVDGSGDTADLINVPDVQGWPVNSLVSLKNQEPTDELSCIENNGPLPSQLAREKLRMARSRSSNLMRPTSVKNKERPTRDLSREKRQLRDSTPPHIKRQRQLIDRVTSATANHQQQSPPAANIAYLLEDGGNLRPPAGAAAVEEDENALCRGGVFDIEAGADNAEPRLARRERLHSILTRSAVLRKTPPSRVQFSEPGLHGSDPSDALLGGGDAVAMGRESSRLGYDWIAGMLENKEGVALDQPPEFYENLRQFRKTFSAECFSKDYRQEAFEMADRLAGSTHGPVPRRLPISQIEEVRELEDPVFAYTVNDRLFAVPVDAEAASREPDQSIQPQIIKVSFPVSRLRGAYANTTTKTQQPATSRLRPHRRRSFDADGDTAALVGHCQVGYCPVPSSSSSLLVARSGLATAATRVVQPRAADTCDLRAASGQGSLLRAQPQTQAEAVAQLKRGAHGARRQRVGASGELPAPDDLLLEEAGGRDTIAGLMSRHHVTTAVKEGQVRSRAQAACTRLSETYRNAAMETD